MTEPFIVADWYIQAAWASEDLDLFTPKSAPVRLALILRSHQTWPVTNMQAGAHHDLRFRIQHHRLANQNRAWLVRSDERTSSLRHRYRRHDLFD